MKRTESCDTEESNNYAIKKTRPAAEQLKQNYLTNFTNVRPNKKYKIDKLDLDGAGFEIHSAIGKLPGCPQKEVGICPGTITLDYRILLTRIKIQSRN